MITESIDEFQLKLPKRQPILGLDVGQKSIGLAISDINLKIATGLKTIIRKKFTADVQLLMEIVNQREIGGIVLGLPKNMNGSEGPRCQSTRAFAKNIATALAIPITFWDERLSTVAAERALLEANTSRKRRSAVVDYVAASYILQGALDRMSALTSNGKNK